MARLTLREREEILLYAETLLEALVALAQEQEDPTDFFKVPNMTEFARDAYRKAGLEEVKHTRHNDVLFALLDRSIEKRTPNGRFYRILRSVESDDPEVQQFLKTLSPNNIQRLLEAASSRQRLQIREALQRAGYAAEDFSR